MVDTQSIPYLSDTYRNTYETVLNIMTEHKLTGFTMRQLRTYFPENIPYHHFYNVLVYLRNQNIISLGRDDYYTVNATTTPIVKHINNVSNSEIKELLLAVESKLDLLLDIAEIPSLYLQEKRLKGVTNEMRTKSS